VSHAFPLSEGRRARATALRHSEQAIGVIEGGEYQYDKEVANPFHPETPKRADRAVGPRAQAFWIKSGLTKRYPGMSAGVGTGRDR
jgi:hypothetical protein